MFQIINGEVTFDWIVLPIVLLSGIILSIYRPYVGFLFSILVPLSFGTNTLLNAKIPGLSLFTLYDISFFTTILSWLNERGKKNKKSELKGKVNTEAYKMASVIIIVLLMGALQSLLRYDAPYLTFRSIRWAINIPILIVIASELVTTRKRVGALLLVLLLGDVFSSIQHLLWLSYQGSIFSSQDQAQAFRNISFLRGQTGWLATGFFYVKGKIANPSLQIFAFALFFVVFITQQTRSIGLSVILSFIITLVFFKKRIKLTGVFQLMLVMAILLIIISTILNATGFGNFMTSYIERTSGTSFDDSSTSDTISRINAFRIETADWISGNPIIGQGLFYYQRYGYGFGGITDEGIIENVAYGHLGYIIYLSQLGIIGFIVYGLWFPISILIKSSKVIKLYQDIPSFQYLGILTVTSFTQSMIGFILSSSFLNPYLIIPGVLAGSIYGISKKDSIQ
jgi:O-Antigen ligase